MLGVGAGGAMHGTEAWEAVGVPYAERGRRTDEALALLPGRRTREASGRGARAGAGGWLAAAQGEPREARDRTVGACGCRDLARSPAEWPGFVISAIFLYRKRTTRSR